MFPRWLGCCAQRTATGNRSRSGVRTNGLIGDSSGQRRHFFRSHFIPAGDYEPPDGAVVTKVFVIVKGVIAIHLDRLRDAGTGEVDDGRATSTQGKIGVRGVKDASEGRIS